MLAVALTVGTLFSIMFFFVGGIVGWLAKEHFYNTAPIIAHPEMFDDNGQLIPDQVIAFNFENYDNDYIEGEES